MTAQGVNDTVLVAGASGFVGGHVARRLAVTEDMHVRALVRNPGGKTVVSLDHPNIEVVKGDVLVPQSLAAACVGARAVVHAVVDAHVRDAAVARATIVDGTRNLYEAARTAGADRFVFVSSIGVYYGFVGWQESDGAPLPDRIPRSGYLYTDAKIDAEEFLTDAPPGGPTVAILRAAAILGPGSREWTVGMTRAARKGKLYLPGGGNFPLPYVYIDNLVDAVVTVLRKGAPGGAFDLLDGRTTYREYAMSVARLAGGSPRSIPFFVVWLAAAVSDTLLRLTGKVRPLSRPLVRVMMANDRRRYVTADKARRELSWEPRVDFAEGMRRTEAWLRANGYLA